jgi:uncharacterized protein YukE
MDPNDVGNQAKESLKQLLRDLFIDDIKTENKQTVSDIINSVGVIRDRGLVEFEKKFEDKYDAINKPVLKGLQADINKLYDKLDNTINNFDTLKGELTKELNKEISIFNGQIGQLFKTTFSQMSVVMSENHQLIMKIEKDIEAVQKGNESLASELLKEIKTILTEIIHRELRVAVDENKKEISSLSAILNKQYKHIIREV